MGGVEPIEGDAEAGTTWVDHVDAVAKQRLSVLANSWYLGANIPVEPRVFLPYPRSVGTHRKKCNEVRDNGYESSLLGAGCAA